MHFFKAFYDFIYWFNFRFGFVDFDTAEAAQKAFDTMKGQEIDGRQIFIDFVGERGGMFSSPGGIFWKLHTPIAQGLN